MSTIENADITCTFLIKLELLNPRRLCRQPEEAVDSALVAWDTVVIKPIKYISRSTMVPMATKTVWISPADKTANTFVPR